MTFDFTDEQRALRQAVRELLDDHGSEPAVRATAASATGVDPDLWKLLAGQLGLAGLVVPERYGGAGAGPVELAIVLEEMGKKLFCGPYLSSSVLAATLLTELSCAEFLPDLASGQRTATVVFAQRSIAAGERLSGEQRFVLDGATADLLLVVTDGPRVFAVDPAADGVSIQPMSTLDGTRRLAAIALDDVPARLVGDPDITAAAVAWTLRTGEIMLAAEQAGGARAVLDMAVEYARTRFQFGRAIGSFQAIKHMCADLLVEVESAYSTAYAAAWALAERSPEATALAAMAQAFCSDAFLRVAADNIQIHGGIGFTWEHPAHLYLRRARSSAQLLGDAETHRERYLSAIADLG
ncbi:acyl-CoA dehydrogenase family protein [Saccharopolyspora sp. NPDC050389]|uniref:acyl-CoA dehydrogenase family protein n=1 Tax=Saccharopolyspora sp. NPDC050389 TaxID=3155516 RepID=UPI0033C696F4